MIIDVHNHIGVDNTRIFQKIYPYCQSAEVLVNILKISEITNSVVFPFPHTMYYDPRPEHRLEETTFMSFPYQVENMYLLYQVAQYGEGKLFPFLCIDPTRKVDDQIKAIYKWKLEHKIYGLKLHTLELGVDGSILNNSEFLKVAKDNNWPIIVHTFLDNLSDPMPTLEVALNNPEINFCFTHGAGFITKFYSIIDSSKPSNIYIDFSPLRVVCTIIEDHAKKYGYEILKLNYKNPSEVVLEMSNKYIDYMVFGSDSPYTTINNPKKNTKFESSIKDEFKVYSSLSEDNFHKVVTKNPLKYLGI